MALVLLVSAGRASYDGLRPPADYAGLLAHCQEVRERLPASANLMVIADRSAVVQYYCDRRGSTVIPAGAKPAVLRDTVLAGGHGRVDDAFADADFVYSPFPHILRKAPRLAAHLDGLWSRVPLSADGPRLWKR